MLFGSCSVFESRGLCLPGVAPRVSMGAIPPSLDRPQEGTPQPVWMGWKSFKSTGIAAGSEQREQREQRGDRFSLLGSLLFSLLLEGTNEGRCLQTTDCNRLNGCRTVPRTAIQAV